MAKWKCNKCGATTSTKPTNMQHSCGGGWRKKEEDQPYADSSPSLLDTINSFNSDSGSSFSSDPSPDFGGGGGDFGGGGASGEW